MKITMPDRYDSFRCLAAACPDTCCRDWEIPVDPDTADFYETLPGQLGEEVRKVLSRSEDGTPCLQLRGGNCPLLDGEGLCRIYKELGEECLSTTCRSHPRFTREYGELREVGLCASCPECARLVLESDLCLTTRESPEPPAGEGYCQPFCDGPENNPDNPVLETYLQIIGQARHMLYLTTPYYAVEASMQEALCIAADAGVDVRLMMPGIPDKKMPYLVAETYWGELLRHGVKIYRYIPGFLHAKSIMADRELALVGSTNMDYRTFQLQYETAVLLYQSPAVEDLLEDMDAIMAESKPYTLEEWDRRSWPRRAVAAVLKLFSIWL